MRIIERSALDCARWDRLVAQKDGASFFSYSWYLDAVAEHWCVLVNDDYTEGIALPYTRRAGVKVLYIPVFGRYVSPVGNISEEDIQQIVEAFPVRELATSSSFFTDAVERVHQVVYPQEPRVLSSQGKRSLKKAQKTGLKVTETDDFTAVMEAIRSELKGKFSGVNAESIDKLQTLFEQAKKRELLRVFEVTDGNETGGIVCIGDEQQLLYVKGACPDQLKQNGGMYLALDTAIKVAMEDEVLFDFGGSNVEGVKRFNHNLGGKDVAYFFHKNSGPGWFRLGRKLKKRIGR